MGLMNYFGRVVLEILENNLLKSYFGNSEIEILFPFLEICSRRKLSLSNHFFKNITLKYTYQQRHATNGYCEVLNVNLNIWFDITSRYTENFCVTVSVAVGIFSERLTDTSCQNFFCLAMVKIDVKSVF